MELIEKMARAMTPLLCGGQEDALGRPLPDKTFDDLPPDWQARFEDYAQAAYAAIADRIEALEAENERLGEALTPSGATKAAYHGEFIFTVTRFDEEGEEYLERHYVPWTTVKEIMAAIAARAALREK